MSPELSPFAKSPDSAGHATPAGSIAPPSKHIASPELYKASPEVPAQKKEERGEASDAAMKREERKKKNDAYFEQYKKEALEKERQRLARQQKVFHTPHPLRIILFF